LWLGNGIRARSTLWIVGLLAVVGSLVLAGTARAAAPATTITVSLSPASIVANGTSTTTPPCEPAASEWPAFE
jgi:hypothetical protein